MKIKINRETATNIIYVFGVTVGAWFGAAFACHINNKQAPAYAKGYEQGKLEASREIAAKLNENLEELKAHFKEKENENETEEEEESEKKSSGRYPWGP